VYFVRMRELYKRFVKTWIRFVSYSQILLHRFANPDLRVRFLKIRIVDSCDLNFQRFDLFSRIQRILSTIAQNKSLRIQAGRFANPDLRIRTLKICIADLIRRAFFKRFVSWIRFVRSKIPNYSIRFVLEGFVYESRILSYDALLLPISVMLSFGLS
jgi:hypothetical protein